jgi:hypothetical protein
VWIAGNLFPIVQIVPAGWENPSLPQVGITRAGSESAATGCSGPAEWIDWPQTSGDANLQCRATGKQHRRQHHPGLLHSSEGSAPQRSAIGRVDVDIQIRRKRLFQHKAYRPAAMVSGNRRPGDGPEAGGAVLHVNPFARLKPGFGRGSLQMNDVAVVLLLTQEPAQAQRRL